MLRVFKKNIKRIVYFISFYSGLLHIFMFLFKKIKRSHCGIVLFYHRFYEDGNNHKLLPSLNIKEFEREIIHLRRLYRLVSMDEMAGKISEKESFREPYIAITIDDGYLDNYSFGYKVLRRCNVPALIYLTTGLIGTAKGLWVDEIEYALINARVKSVCFEELFGDSVINVSTIDGRRNLEKMLYSALVKLDNSKRQDLINKLIEILNVDVSGINKRPRVMLNWEEIGEMSRNGIDFGAHTISHPFLPSMAMEDAKKEIKESKEAIEEYLGKPVRHFAIPNGKLDDFNEELRDLCKEVGFETVVTTEFGAVDPASNRYELKRITAPTPMYYFACEIARHFIFWRKG